MPIDHDYYESKRFEAAEDREDRLLEEEADSEAIDYEGDMERNHES
jgi:hypothetical protein